MRKRGARFTRHVDHLAAFRSAGRQHPLDASQKQRLGNALRVHLEAIRLGKADEMAFYNLANGVNVSMVLAEDMQHVEGLAEVVGAAQAAMSTLRTNGRTRGRWLLDGPSLQAVITWLAVYEQQLAVVSQQEAMNALDEVKRRMARGMVFEDQPQGAAA